MGAVADPRVCVVVMVVHSYVTGLGRGGYTMGCPHGGGGSERALLSLQHCGRRRHEDLFAASPAIYLSVMSNQLRLCPICGV